jgi:hypothetical protein
MPYILTSPDGRADFARATLNTVRGNAGVGFFRLTVAAQAPAESGPQLTELFAEVRIGPRPVGWFYPLPGFLPVRPYPARTTHQQLQLCCDLDRARIEAIEAERAGRDLALDVQLYWRLGDRQASNGDRLEVNQGVWIDVLQQMGYKQTAEAGGVRHQAASAYASPAARSGAPTAASTPLGSARSVLT